MILKCIKDIRKEGLSVNKIYPVIGYKINKENNEIFYQILDDDKSLSWRQDNRFVVLNFNKINYVKIYEEETIIKYVYKDLSNENFLSDYYCEDESSIKAKGKLKNTLILILSNELSVSELMRNFIESDYMDENSEILLNAFFLKANEHDISDLAQKLYTIALDLKPYLIDIIVKKLSNYKKDIINDLFMELYMNSTSCNETSLGIIEKYLWE